MVGEEFIARDLVASPGRSPFVQSRATARRVSLPPDRSCPSLRKSPARGRCLFTSLKEVCVRLLYPGRVPAGDCPFRKIRSAWRSSINAASSNVLRALLSLARLAKERDLVDRSCSRHGAVLERGPARFSLLNGAKSRRLESGVTNNSRNSPPRRCRHGTEARFVVRRRLALNDSSRE